MHETDADPAARAARAAQWLETGRLMGVPFAVQGGESALPAAAPHVPAARPDAKPAPGPAPAPSPASAAPPAVSTPSPASPASPEPPADRAAALAALADRYRTTVAEPFTDHPFTNVVFGEGDPAAALMIVGEAPGADEDRLGRPFVGRAGEKLDDMIRAMKLARESVYIANVLKIRPPGNRTPLAPEVARCGPFLREQIRIIRPRAILALGGPATKWLLQTETGITRLRGVWAEYRDPELEGLTVPVLPTFHPAYLLRTYTRDVREKMWHDLQQVMGRLAGEGAA